MTMRRLALVFVSVFAAGGPLVAERAEELFQPLESERGLVLSSSTGRARVESPAGRSELIPVRRDERLTVLAETAGGWAAAGVRDIGYLQELTLHVGDSGGRRRLPVPGGQEGALRLRPILLLERGDLAGMAWLEGDGFRRLAVWAAGWSGAEWGPATRVSAPGAGNQTGLAGVVLADGAWLLVWSGHDGDDDEILWSLRRGESWSEPERLGPANGVPDITPSVIPAGRGALAVWSRLNGTGYGLMRARFSGSGWSSPSPDGPPGSIYPRLISRQGRAYLVFQNAWPAGWTVGELGSDGRMRRRARFEDVAQNAYPAMVAAHDGGVALRWPGSGRRQAERVWEVVP